MLWDHSRLYLIMDYVDLDLREHMDTNPDAFALENVKVTFPVRAPQLNAHRWTLTSQRSAQQP